MNYLHPNIRQSVIFFHLMCELEIFMEGIDLEKLGLNLDSLDVSQDIIHVSVVDSGIRAFPLIVLSN